ncbi:MAG: hypothetical protein GW911_07725 [Armatimonadetes bacterium]|nr:hypothetical protein [Armatimonadota bacterium]
MSRPASRLSAAASAALSESQVIADLKKSGMIFDAAKVLPKSPRVPGVWVAHPAR